jgi:AcrR family transcriptional regulator
MPTRSETCAETRRRLLLAASDLLDMGGPEAVTLRAVGARAGVSRGAPYGHFTGKDHLLAQLAVGSWNDLANEVEHLRADLDIGPSMRLQRALLSLIDLSRQRPQLYALMFATPADNPEAQVAATRLNDQFLAIVADAVGTSKALPYGALLLSSAHGIAGLELSGHLGSDKWTVEAEELVRMLVENLPER